MRYQNTLSGFRLSPGSASEKSVENFYTRPDARNQNVAKHLFLNNN